MGQDVRSFLKKRKENYIKKQWLPTLKESNNCSLLRKEQLKKFLRLVREKIADRSKLKKKPRLKSKDTRLNARANFGNMKHVMLDLKVMWLPGSTLMLNYVLIL